MVVLVFTLKLALALFQGQTWSVTVMSMTVTVMGGGVFLGAAGGFSIWCILGCGGFGESGDGCGVSCLAVLLDGLVGGI